MATFQVGLSKLSALCLSALIATGMTWASAEAAGPEKRVALVIGNGSYPGHALATAANDAGLIAQTLQAAGFDVVGARDLDQASLRQSLHDFRSKVEQAGPDAVALIYLNGYALQFEGENYFVPIDANIHAASDVPTEAIRISDYTKSIAALSPKAEITIVDAARPNPFPLTGEQLAGGLALAEAQPGTLIAFNASPGTVQPAEAGPYGTYAHALADAMRQGGLSLAQTFEQANLRVNQLTHGAEVPWDDAKVTADFEFFTLAADAPAPKASRERFSAMADQPIRSFSAADAYAAAIMRGTMQGYLDFLAAYPDDPMAPRIRAIVAARREAIVWRRTWLADTREAYWTYLRRYPRGPHVWDARHRLRELAAELDPPSAFVEIDYGLPPPPPDEITIVERPFIFFGDFGYPPPPPPPEYFLPPIFTVFYDLPPPPPPAYAYVLPVPVFVPVPVWVEHPAYLQPPPPSAPNVYYQNFHNTVVVNLNAATVSVTSPAGKPVNPPVLPQQGVAGAAAPSHLPLLAPALPASLAKHVEKMGGLPALKGNATLPGAASGAAAPAATAPNAAAGNALPKQNQLPAVLPGNGAKAILPPPAGAKTPLSAPLPNVKIQNKAPVLQVPGAQGAGQPPPAPGTTGLKPDMGKLNAVKPRKPLNIQDGKILATPNAPPPPAFKTLKKPDLQPPNHPPQNLAPAGQPKLYRKPNMQMVPPGASQGNGQPQLGNGKPGPKAGPKHGCKPGERFEGGKCVGP